MSKIQAFISVFQTNFTTNNLSKKFAMIHAWLSKKEIPSKSVKFYYNPY